MPGVVTLKVFSPGYELGPDASQLGVPEYTKSSRFNLGSRQGSQDGDAVDQVGRKK